MDAFQEKRLGTPISVSLQEKRRAQEVLDEALSFATRFMRISKEEALKNLFQYIPRYEGKVEKILEEIEFVLPRREEAGLNFHKEVAHYIHEIVEASEIKRVFGKVVTPYPNWEKTIYYKTAHPVALKAEEEYLSLVSTSKKLAGELVEKYIEELVKKYAEKARFKGTLVVSANPYIQLEPFFVKAVYHPPPLAYPERLEEEAILLAFHPEKATKEGILMVLAHELGHSRLLRRIGLKRYLEKGKFETEVIAYKFAYHIINEEWRKPALAKQFLTAIAQLSKKVPAAAEAKSRLEKQRISNKQWLL